LEEKGVWLYNSFSKKVVERDGIVYYHKNRRGPYAFLTVHLKGDGVRSKRKLRSAHTSAWEGVAERKAGNHPTKVYSDGGKKKFEMASFKAQRQKRSHSNQHPEKSGGIS